MIFRLHLEKAIFELKRYKGWQHNIYVLRYSLRYRTCHDVVTIVSIQNCEDFVLFINFSLILVFLFRVLCGSFFHTCTVKCVLFSDASSRIVHDILLCSVAPDISIFHNISIFCRFFHNVKEISFLIFLNSQFIFGLMFRIESIFFRLV